MFLGILSYVTALTTDSWDNTLYSFNKTQDGAAVDDCNGLNWDTWNITNATSFSINTTLSKCQLGTGSGGFMLYGNLNHTFDGNKGIIAQVKDWQERIQANDVQGFSLSNTSYAKYYATQSYGAYHHLGFGNSNYEATQHFGTNVVWQDTVGWTYNIMIQMLKTYAIFDWDDGTRIENYSGGYTTCVDNMTYRWQTLTPASTILHLFDDLRVYHWPMLNPVNFTLTLEGVGAAGYTVEFYNTSTNGLIDNATSDANGLAQINLSKGAGLSYSGYPFNITVVIKSGSGSVLVNETVVASETKGIYPNDVFLYQMYAPSEYNTVSLNNPADDAHNNSNTQTYCYTPILNASGQTCYLYTNETGAWQAEETLSSPTNNTLNCFSHTIAADGAYVWNVYCPGAWATANYTYILDTIDPVMILTSPTQNNTYFKNTGTYTIQFSCTDPYIYQTGYNITNTTGHSVAGNINTTASGTSLSMGAAISLAAYTDDIYDATLECADSHTISTWDALIEEELYSDGASYTIDKTEKIEIKIKDIVGDGKLEKYESIKLKDRMVFNLTFDADIESFTYEIKADSYKRYYSDYAGHYIISGRYWFDVEPYKACGYEEKNSKLYIEVCNIQDNQVLTQSLGGLNYYRTNYTFTVDSQAPIFTSTGINNSHVIRGDWVAMRTTINDNNPGNYTFGWNYSGTMSNVTTASGYSSGVPIQYTQQFNNTGTYCFNYWANDLSLNVNATADNCFNVTSYYLNSVTYGNYTSYMTMNWTRVLNYTLNYTCNGGLNLSVYAGNTVNRTENLTCDNSYHIYSGTYRHGSEGNYTIAMLLDDGAAETFYYNSTFMSDLYNPDININFTFNEGFTDQLANVTLWCNDSALGWLWYNLTFNGASLYNANYTGGSNVTNRTTYNHGLNNVTGQCIDLFGRVSRNYLEYVYFTRFALIDERTRSNFTVTNCSSAKIYYNNVSYYDLINNATSHANFTGSSNTQIRVELIYDRSGVINTYIDTSLLSSDVRVCANPDDVTRYAEYIYSATEKPALLKNTYAECYVAADYTRFAYENSLLLKGITIDAQYILYTYDNGQLITLGGIDGSVSSNINLDTLIFNQNAYDLNILTEAIAFEKDADFPQVTIYYKNQAGEVISGELTIYNMDDNTELFTQTDFSDPNEFTTYFSWAAVANVTNATIFKAIYTKETEAGEESLTRYFGIDGNAGILNNKVAIAIAILLLIFGLSFAISRITFSWFGIFIEIAALFVLTAGTGGWIINFLIALDIIIIVYTFIMATQQNYVSLT